MIARRVFAIGLGSFGIFVGVLAFFEFRAFTKLSTASFLRLPQIQQELNPYVLSYLARSERLEACLDASIQKTLILHPAAVQQHSSQQCRNLSEHVLKSSPQNGFAHLALGSQAADLNDFEVFNAAIAQSHLNTPHELWIVERRVRVLVSNMDVLDQTSRAILRKDIAAMANNTVGRDSLAVLYRAFENLRPVVQETVEGLPEDVQMRFVWALERLS